MGFAERTIGKTWLVSIALAALIAAVFTYYGRGYEHLPSDDPAASVIGARYMAETQGSKFLNPLSPDLGVPLYSNIIGTEFPVHTFLAELFLIFGMQNILTVSNIALLSVFLLSGVMLFVLFYELTHHRGIALLGVGVALLSRWYGQMFWTGHYAQIFASSLLVTVMIGLLRYERTNESRWVVLVACATLLLFPVHSLSFLVAFATSSAFFLVQWTVRHRNVRVRLGMIGVYGVTLVVFFLLAKLFSHPERYYPLFSVEDVSGGTLTNILAAGYDSLFAAPLVLLGAYSGIRRRKVALLSWFLVCYLLVNSGNLGFPFFQYRFNEFISTPLTALLLIGVMELFSLLRTRVVQGAVLAAIACIYIPTGLAQQNVLRSCHIAYCPGLNPVSIVPEDFSAFQWLERETPKDAWIIDTPKFGIYIPAIAKRNVLFPVSTATHTNMAYTVLTHSSQEERWKQAHAAGASYIVWDGVMDRYQATYVPYQVYSEHFDDPQFFRKVYDEQGVRIYEVLEP